ncbi:MAG TPA: hypothetical protein VFE50_16275 [Cyclobacteriaceae bacterium]|nr:hypothetical protein [Cyclobacteriaceae bacterium]
MRLLLLIFVFFSDVNITLKNNTEAEQKAKVQLERIIATYRISQWLYTKDIMINEKEYIPFSHPILTVNHRYLDNDLKQMSTFIHEQFHWTENRKAKEFAAAINEFKQMFPEVPVGKDGGARDSYSTYLHLIVCNLEYEAMTSIVGQAEARKVIESWSHYKWIYDKVLNDTRIAEVTKKHGITI